MHPTKQTFTEFKIFLLQYHEQPLGGDSQQNDFYFNSNSVALYHGLFCDANHFIIP